MNFSDQRDAIGTGAVRTLAIIGFLALVGIGMWGSVTVARAVPGALQNIAAAVVSFTQIFIPASETITLSAPLTTPSGQPVTISFSHEDKNTDGSYTFRFNCVEGVAVTSGQNGATESIFCNVPFHFINTANTITITPDSSANRFVDIEVFIDFTPNGAATPTVTGSTALTIENEGVTGSPATLTPNQPAATTPTVPTAPSAPRAPGQSTSNTYPITGTVAVSNPNGFVDLTARVIEVGVVDKTTGAFTASSTPQRVPQNARVAVRFAIENNGTKTSPEFAFNAVLPTYPAHVFSSPMQQALGPGDRIEFTLGFDQFIDATQGEVTINIDPTGRINEPNKVNNIIKYTVVVVK